MIRDKRALPGSGWYEIFVGRYTVVKTGFQTHLFVHLMNFANSDSAQKQVQDDKVS